MTDVIMRKTRLAGRQCLVPVDEHGFEYLSRIRDNRDVGITVKQHRNSRHHRLFWKIVSFVKQHAVVDGESIFANVDKEAIAQLIKIKCGYAKLFVDADTGTPVWVPKSINWATMDQTQFQPFFQQAVDLICQRWMPPGTVPEDVRRELIELVDGPHALPERAA